MRNQSLGRVYPDNERKLKTSQFFRATSDDINHFNSKKIAVTTSAYNGTFADISDFFAAIRSAPLCSIVY
jgi:hypothetical protein